MKMGNYVHMTVNCNVTNSLQCEVKEIRKRENVTQVFNVLQNNCLSVRCCTNNNQANKHNMTMKIERKKHSLNTNKLQHT